MDAQGLILFDCDGTLVDSHEHILFTMQQAIAACGFEVPPDDNIRGIIGLSLDSAVARLLPKVGMLERGCVTAAYRKQYTASGDAGALHPGVRQTLLQLSGRGYCLGIVTGKSRRGLLRMLQQHDMHEIFHVYRTADCCPSKPHPAMVLECMQEMTVPAGNTTVVGDSRFDMEMAAASGVRALGVSFGVEPREILFNAGAIIVVDRFEDLLEHFPPLRDSRRQSNLKAS